MLLTALANIATQVQSEEPQASTRLTPAEIKLYERAPTLLEWTPREINAHRELRGLGLAENQSELPTILMEVGEPVAAQMSGFRNTACLEHIQSESCRVESSLRILPGGIPEEYDGRGVNCTVFFEGQFHYLWLVHARKGGAVLEEYRTDAKDEPADYRDPSKSLPLLTWGFSSAALYFHPRNQPACRFRYFGRQMVKGRPTDVVGFAPIPNADAPSIAMQFGSVQAQMIEQGLAWIDAGTHEILRIQTNLLAPRPDVHIDKESSEIDFSTVHLADVATPLRLPTKVVVDVESHHQHLRNTHTYSRFKMFRVESRILAAPPN